MKKIFTKLLTITLSVSVLITGISASAPVKSTAAQKSKKIIYEL